MYLSELTHVLIRALDRIGRKLGKPQTKAAHAITGRAGEEQAYFYLRRMGYVIVARNFRTSRGRGEVDLIGWEKNVLCFIEVKTRSSHDVKPAQTAVDRRKLRLLTSTAREYLRHLPPSCPWRIDVVSVYYEGTKPLNFELFRNVLPPS